MKLCKVDKKGKPTSIPEDMGVIIRRLGISAPARIADALDYLLSIGYAVVEPNTIPAPPAELRGRCRIDLGIPTVDAEGKYVRTYTFTELDETAIEFLNVQNRFKRDKALTGIVDTVNAIRWASMTPEKQEEWKSYRQALLDISKQDGWPANIVWPNIPV